MLGGGLARVLPLPFCSTFRPSSDELDNHLLASYLSGKGSRSLSSLTHLAGEGSPTEHSLVDGLIINQLEGGGLSTFLLVDDEDDLVIELTRSWTLPCR